MPPIPGNAPSRPLRPKRRPRPPRRLTPLRATARPPDAGTASLARCATSMRTLCGASSHRPERVRGRSAPVACVAGPEPVLVFHTAGGRALRPTTTPVRRSVSPTVRRTGTRPCVTTPTTTREGAFPREAPLAHARAHRLPSWTRPPLTLRHCRCRLPAAINVTGRQKGDDMGRLRRRFLPAGAPCSRSHRRRSCSGRGQKPDLLGRSRHD